MTYDRVPPSARASISQELLAFAYGRLVEDAPEGFKARLPVPPMLMVDRIDRHQPRAEPGPDQSPRATCASTTGSSSATSSATRCSPAASASTACGSCSASTAPGAGGVGAGRALGCGEVEFFGQIRPHDRVMRYEIDIKRYTELPERGRLDGRSATRRSLIDDEEIYTMKGAKVGIFRDIDYRDYPFPSERSRGGRMER